MVAPKVPALGLVLILGISQLIQVCPASLPGDTSTPGPTGGTSTPGPTGSSATPGPTGSSATPGPTGNSATPGPTGTTSTPGPTGSSATPGTTGTTSTPGPDYHKVVICLKEVIDGEVFDVETTAAASVKCAFEGKSNVLADAPLLSADEVGCVNFDVEEIKIDSLDPIVCLVKDIVMDGTNAWMPSFVGKMERETYGKSATAPDTPLYRYQGVALVYPDRELRGDKGDVNGCGPALVPSIVLKLGELVLPFNFDQSCNSHDKCWASCDQTKLSCDDEFRSNMYAQCSIILLDSDVEAGVVPCQEQADIFYEAVSGFVGDFVFTQTQEKWGCSVREGDNPSDNPSEIIKVCVKAKEIAKREPLIGVTVECFSKQEDGSALSLASGTTAHSGCVEISFSDPRDQVSADSSPDYPLVMAYLKRDAFVGFDWFQTVSDFIEPPSFLDVYCRAGTEASNTAYGGFQTVEGESRMKRYSDFAGPNFDFSAFPYLHRSTTTDAKRWAGSGHDFEFDITVYPDRVQRGDAGASDGCAASFLPKDLQEKATGLLPFDSSCSNHDLCWASCHETQATCDEEFKDMMHSKCRLLRYGGSDNDLDSCLRKADQLHKTVNGGPGKILHFKAQSDAGCSLNSRPTCFALVGDYFKLGATSIAEKFSTTNQYSNVIPCPILPVDQADQAQPFNFYAPPSWEILVLFVTGMMFALGCILEALPFDIGIDLPDLTIDLGLPKFEGDLKYLSDQDSTYSSSPFLDFEPLQACCEGGDISKDILCDVFEDEFKNRMEDLGEGSSEVAKQHNVCAREDFNPSLEGYYMPCNGQVSCDKCLTDDPCTTCKMVGESCTSGAECCQYSDNKDLVFICKKEIVNDQLQEVGKCQLQPIAPIGWSPMCIAFNAIGPLDTVAFAFPNGILPFEYSPMMKIPGSGTGSFRISKSLCKFHSGVPVIHAKYFVGVARLIGLGISSQNRLSFGVNSWTRGNQYNSKLKLWDGFLEVGIPPRDGIDFWAAMRLEFFPSPNWQLKKSLCEAPKAPAELAAVEELKKQVNTLTDIISLRLDFELYIDGGGEPGAANGDPCVLVTMPSATIFLILFQFRVGRGIGGYCRNKTPNRCSPSGFFLNIEPTFEAKSIATESALGFLFSGFDASVGDEEDEIKIKIENKPIEVSGGLSFGVFLDDETGEIRSAVFRLETPQLKIFGFAIAPQIKVHFQWFKGSELERRRWTILRRQGQGPNCPGTATGCTVWKKYWGYDDDKWEICQDKLFELDPYNKIIMALSDTNGIEFPKRVTAETAPTAWFINRKFDLSTSPDSDVLVVYLAITEWGSPLVRLENLAMTVISVIDREDVYISVELEISVLGFIKLQAAASIQNNVGGSGSDYWVVAFEVEAGAKGFLSFAVKGTSKPFQWNELRRQRLLEEARKDDTEESRQLQRRLSQPPENLDWNLSTKFEFDLLDDILDALGPVGDAIEAVANAIINTAKEILSAVGKFLGRAAGIIKNGFKELGNFVGKIFSGTVNFKDVKNLFLKGTQVIADLVGLAWNAIVDLAKKAFKEIGKFFGDVGRFIGGLFGGTWYEEKTDSRPSYSCKDEYGCPSRCRRKRACWRSCCHTCSFFGHRFCCWWGCIRRGPWKIFGKIRNKKSIEEVLDEAQEVDKNVKKAEHLDNVVKNNNKQNVKGLRYALKNKDSLGHPKVAVEYTPISTAEGGRRANGVSLRAKGLGLPILRPNRNKPRRENSQLEEVTFDFFGTDPGDMRNALASKLKGSLKEKVLRETRLEGTEFMQYHKGASRPHLLLRGRLLAEDTTTPIVWDECRNGKDEFDLDVEIAWQFGTKAIAKVVRQWIMKKYPPQVTVDGTLDDKSYELEWTTLSSEYKCDHFAITLEVKATDAGDRPSDSHVFMVEIPYGVPSIEKEEGSSVSESTRCHNDTFGELHLEQFGLATPTIVETHCPSPFLDLAFVDNDDSIGIQCTTNYRVIKRVWEMISTNNCELPIGTESSTFEQTMSLGGRREFSFRLDFALQYPDATEEELEKHFAEALENHQIPFLPATPDFLLEDITYELPDVPSATVDTKPGDYYQDGLEPVSECGLCEISNPIKYSHPQSFTCSEVGENTISITVTNNIGVSETKEAIATVVDLHPPTLTCQAALYAQCGNIDPEVIGTPNAVDNCHLESLTFSDTNDSSFDGECPMSTTRTWTAIDSSGNEASCTQTIIQVDPSITNGAFCPFDMDPTGPSQVFRTIYAPSISHDFQLATTIPGQFYYNLFHMGTPGHIIHFEVKIPYPFITLGPIRAYSELSLRGNDERRPCFHRFQENDLMATLPNKVEWAHYKELMVGKRKQLVFDIKTPASGFIHVAIHLGYGLVDGERKKHSNGVGQGERMLLQGRSHGRRARSEDREENVAHKFSSTTQELLKEMHAKQEFVSSVSTSEDQEGTSTGGTDDGDPRRLTYKKEFEEEIYAKPSLPHDIEVFSTKFYKREPNLNDPGVGGFVPQTNWGEPMKGIMVTLHPPGEGALPSVGFSDQDGYYFIPFDEPPGKVETSTLTIEELGLSEEITIGGNDHQYFVDFKPKERADGSTDDSQEQEESRVRRRRLRFHLD